MATPSPSPIRRALPVVIVLALAATGVVGWRALTAPRVLREAGGYSVVRGREMYRFDTVFGTETLWEEGADGTFTQVTAPDPARVAPHRAALLGRLGLRSVDEIPREREGDRQALEGIGYL